MLKAATINLLFNDPHLATDATYTPEGGQAATVRVIEITPDSIRPINGTGFMLPAHQADVRVADIATPDEGGTLVYGGRTFTITGFEARQHNLVWRLELALEE